MVDWSTMPAWFAWGMLTLCVANSFTLLAEYRHPTRMGRLWWGIGLSLTLMSGYFAAKGWGL